MQVRHLPSKRSGPLELVAATASVPCGLNREGDHTVIVTGSSTDTASSITSFSRRIVTGAKRSIFA